jgi:hypothetical protein
MGRCVGGVDAALGEPEQAHDDQNRSCDEQCFVPAALVGDEHGCRDDGEDCGEDCGHVYRSYGLG